MPLTTSKFKLSVNQNGEESPIMPDAVFEIGKDLSAFPEAAPLLLRGPYIQCAYNYGWRRWERKVRSGIKTDDWEEKRYDESTLHS